METEGIYQIASDFTNEFIETYIEYITKEKHPLNLEIVRVCLTEAIILTLFRRIRKIKEPVLWIYVDIISCVYSGRTFCGFMAKMENAIKAKQEEGYDLGVCF